MTEGKNESAMLQELGVLGFSPEDITLIIQTHGWTVRALYDAVKGLLDQGQASKTSVRTAFEELHPELFEAPPGSELLSLFRPLDRFDQQEISWLVAGLIPKGQITTLASDGGIGKTGCWIALSAAVSAGTACFLDPPGTTRSPGKVLFLSSEDSVRVVLKKRLCAAGANLQNIVSPDFASDRLGSLRGLKFGSEELRTVLASIRPALCIFDPIQGFIPHGINMGDRGSMRDCMAPLITLGEQYGTAFLIVCHTNKRQNASSRDRMADSADLWDISRSVLMMGRTGEPGISYLSHEKSNYGPLQETRLFSVNASGILQPQGFTWKRDRDFIQEKASSHAPLREDCKAWIVHQLEESGGQLPIQELSLAASRFGFTDKTLERAKKDLSDAGTISRRSSGFGADKKWMIELTVSPEPLSA